MILFFRFSLLVFLCSYTVGETESTMEFADFYHVEGVGYRFDSDSGKYHRMDFYRKDPSLCQGSFVITGIKRDRNEPALQIERPKECDEMHELVWD
ncbi:MAG: hypothetical protein PSV36_10580 [Algoriphagus sp.]|nr:hypothetical protein [Algoriphagus sp.]